MLQDFKITHMKYKSVMYVSTMVSFKYLTKVPVVPAPA